MSYPNAYDMVKAEAATRKPLQEEIKVLKESVNELLKALEYCVEGVKFNSSSEILELIQKTKNKL